MQPWPGVPEFLPSTAAACSCHRTGCMEHGDQATGDSGFPGGGRQWDRPKAMAQPDIQVPCSLPCSSLPPCQHPNILCHRAARERAACVGSGGLAESPHHTDPPPTLSSWGWPCTSQATKERQTVPGASIPQCQARCARLGWLLRAGRGRAASLLPLFLPAHPSSGTANPEAAGGKLLPSPGQPCATRYPFPTSLFPPGPLLPSAPKSHPRGPRTSPAAPPATPRQKHHPCKQGLHCPLLYEGAALQGQAKRVTW